MVSLRVWDPRESPQFGLLLPFIATHIQHNFGAGRDFRQSLRAAWVYQNRLLQMFNLTLATRTHGVEEWDFADFATRPFGRRLPSNDHHTNLCLTKCGDEVANWVLLSRALEHDDRETALQNLEKLKITGEVTGPRSGFLACRTSGLGFDFNLAANEAIKFDAGAAILMRLVHGAP
jgi:hypothetical protein